MPCMPEFIFLEKLWGICIKYMYKNIYCKMTDRNKIIVKSQPRGGRWNMLYLYDRT